MVNYILITVYENENANSQDNFINNVLSLCPQIIYVCRFN